MTVSRLYDTDEQDWATDCNGDKPNGEYLIETGCNCSPMDGGMCGCCVEYPAHYTSPSFGGIYILACKRKLKRLGYRIPPQTKGN